VGGDAPLWFYCLRETELGGGLQLGPVMGRIVAEVILGLLQVDKFNSYWNAPAPFTAVIGQTFNMGDMLKLIDARIIDPTSGRQFDAPNRAHVPLNQLDPLRNPENFQPQAVSARALARRRSSWSAVGEDLDMARGCVYVHPRLRVLGRGVEALPARRWVVPERALN